MDVDVELFGRLISRLEADANKHGWDEPHHLVIIYDHRDPVTGPAYRGSMGSHPATKLGPYIAQMMPPLPAGNGAHVVFRFALNLLAAGVSPAADELRSVLTQPGFLGMAVLHEAWMATGTGQEQMEALRSANRTVALADMPGSKEVRMAVGVDREDRIYVCTRIRGEKPTLVCQDDPNSTDGGANNYQGAVPWSLRAIVASLCGRDAPDCDYAPYGWVWPDEGDGATRRTAERYEPDVNGPDPAWFALLANEVVAAMASRGIKLQSSDPGTQVARDSVVARMLDEIVQEVIEQRRRKGGAGDQR